MCKKHYSDFTKDEKRLLTNTIRKLRNHEFSIHTRERMLEKNIKTEDIEKIFGRYSIIEFHKKRDGDLRVLLRGEIPFNDNNTCISMSLENGKIITCYQNNYDDRHSTIRWEEYDKNINIVEELNTYKKLRNRRYNRAS